MARLTLHIAAFFMATAMVFGQKSTLSSEKNIGGNTVEYAYLHISSPTLVTGETLYYKLYALDGSGKTSQVSKIAYVELYSADSGVPVFRHKLFLAQGDGSGDFLLLPSLATGNYKLVGYTNQMQRVNGSYASVDLLFINPFSANPEKNESSGVTETITAATNQNSILAADKSEFGKRELIRLKPTQNLKGNFSVSVRKTGDLPTGPIPDASTFSTVQAQTPKPSLITEARGEIVTGKVSSKNGASVANHNISLSIAGDNPVYKVARVEQNGDFIFTIDRPYASPQALIQILGDDRDNFSVTVNSQRDVLPVTVKPTYAIASGYAEAIKSRSLAAQVENAYYEKKHDSIISAAKQPLFYEPLDRHYKLDAYTRFPTFKETVTEVVKDAYYSLDEGVYGLRVRDYDLQHEVAAKPLVFVDGLQIQDLKYLFDYKPAQIDDIGVVTGGYYYQSTLFNGIFSVTTKTNDFISFEKGDYLTRFPIGLPAPTKKYFQPNYASNANKRIPDFRYQLLWLPKVESLANDIAFYSSDVAGTYEVVVQGFAENGVPTSSRSTFTVR